MDSIYSLESLCFKKIIEENISYLEFKEIIPFENILILFSKYCEREFKHRCLYLNELQYFTKMKRNSGTYLYNEVILDECNCFINKVSIVSTATSKNVTTNLEFLIPSNLMYNMHNMYDQFYDEEDIYNTWPCINKLIVNFYYIYLYDMKQRNINGITERDLLNFSVLNDVNVDFALMLNVRATSVIKKDLVIKKCDYKLYNSCVKNIYEGNFICAVNFYLNFYLNLN
jgi:hypothetical protein